MVVQTPVVKEIIEITDEEKAITKEEQTEEIKEWFKCFNFEMIKLFN